MKIGILTYHRTHNYGGCLQALALRLVLVQLGYKAYYVDYWPKYHQRKYAAFNIDEFRSLGIKGKLSYTLKAIKHLLFYLKRKRNFDKFHKIHTIPYCKPTDDTFDAVIYGSDQIWRKQSHSHQYNPIYFGINDFKTPKHFSYAASMGILPTNLEEIHTVVDLVSHLDRVGVRELDLKELLTQNGVQDVKLTIDPTLLLDSVTWDKYVPSASYSGRPYILVYELWGKVFDMKSIHQYARNRNLLVKVLRGRPTHNDTETEITTAGPESFLSLIKNAEIVFTSSFHGLVFSIIYHKKFFTSFEKNSGRAESLLNLLGLSNRYLHSFQPITQKMLNQEIDYIDTDKYLSDLRMTSIHFLQSINLNRF